jgi:MoxR-like ATPase
MNRKNLVATLVAALTAAPLHAAQYGFGEALPNVRVIAPLTLVTTPLVQGPLALDARLLQVPTSPASAFALDAAKLPQMPQGAVVLRLPLAAIPASQAVSAQAPSGPKAMAADLGRVSMALAAMPGDAKSGGGSGGARQAGDNLERALTGETAAGAGDVTPAADARAQKKEQIAQAKATIQKIIDEVGKVIVGQDEMKRAIIMAMIARQHVLLEGLPGVAKTETAKAFADAVEGNFQRVQGTPDKLPSDILGSEVLQEDPATGKKSFELTKGPVFTNILLLDEINRMPPKAQAALLEAMAEGRVTIGRQTLQLERFTVLATQNPVEQDGTYRLPEAQLDRFMFKVLVPQPTAAELKRILQVNKSRDDRPRASKVTTLAQLDEMRRLAESLTMTEDVEDFIVRVAMAASQKDLKGTVEYTVYTRAAIYLAQSARIHALMQGREFVTSSDVRAVAPLVLRHRIALSYSAQGTTVEELIQTLLDRTSDRPKAK